MVTPSVLLPGKTFVSPVLGTGFPKSCGGLALERRKIWTAGNLPVWSLWQDSQPRAGFSQATLLSFQVDQLARTIAKRETVLVERARGARLKCAFAGENNTSGSVEKVEQEEEEELTRGQLLWRCAKVPIYSVAIIPLTVGGATAFWQTGLFNVTRYWLMFWSSILIITWLNLSNDAYDSQTGVDKNKRESIVNLTGSPTRVLRASQACLILGVMGLVFGAIQAHDMRVTLLLATAIGCGYVYQCPPFRLSYKGLGEPLCFLAFGPLATTAFYLSQAQGSASVLLPVTLSIMGVSVLVGITTSLILFCSHFHQIEGDALCGKLSPLVRMGTKNGSKVVQAAVTGLYLLVAVLTAVKALPFSCTVLSVLTLPIGIWVLNFVKNNHSNKKLIFMAKYYALRLHVSFGAAISLGFYLASRLQLTSRLPLPAVG